MSEVFPPRPGRKGRVHGNSGLTPDSRISMNVVLQPSVQWMELNEKIKDTGLFFPIDPGPSVSCVTQPCAFSMPVGTDGRRFRRKSAA
jgi:hypothetical protein